MEAGRLREEGEINLDEAIEDQAGPDEMFDESGNKITVNKMKTMAAKDVKKAMKELEKKLKDNKKKPTLGEEEVWELQDKLEELKQTLEVTAK